MTRRGPVVAYGATEVATWLGIGRSAVIQYLHRYPNEVPAPDVVIVTPGQEAWGWSADRRPEWEAFYAARHRVREPGRKRYSERFSR